MENPSGFTSTLFEAITHIQRSAKEKTEGILNALNLTCTFNVRKTYLGENTQKRKKKDYPGINAA